MAILSLKFRLDELSQEGRPFAGALPIELVGESVQGLVGDLGYRPLAPLAVDGTVYRSAGGEVIVDGHYATRLGFDCVRCLEAREMAVEARVDHVLVASKEGDDEADDEDDPDVYRFSGESVDLTEMFREDLVLDLPMNPDCEAVEAACTALATEATTPTGAAADAPVVDPRWAPLLDLKKKLNPPS